MKDRAITLFLIIFTLISCEEASEYASDRTDPEEKTEEPVLAKYDFDHSFIMGHFLPDTHPDFVKIDPVYTDKTDIYLQKETYDAFLKMHTSAKEAGIELKILSATRNFEAQKSIWEAKWTGRRTIEGGENLSLEPDSLERARKILLYSSMPGSSRHHWGTDVDFNRLSNRFFETGEGQIIYDWLISNGSEFGFCQPYTQKGVDRLYGYEEEKWHWTYVPLSQEYTQYVRDSFSNQNISGFLGSSTAEEMKIKERYMLGINPDCF